MESCDEPSALAVVGAEPALIEQFFHVHGHRPRALLGAPNETLREVLIRLEIHDARGDMFIFVGECDEALREPLGVEDGVDEHAPVDIDLTLEVLEIHRHRHVHRHGCRHIQVEVNFGGKTKRHKFSPATTIDVVAQWARKKFPNADAASIADFVLEVVDTKAQPRLDEHLGELVAASTCSIAFRLVKEITPQG